MKIWLIFRTIEAVFLFKLNSFPHQLSKLLLFPLVSFLAFACTHRDQTLENEEIKVSSNKPPAYIQKAWNARYDYDTERRLLVPKYAGSRWGAVQQYKEDGSLEYQDWWVRDLQREKLSPTPSIEITTFIDEDGNLTQVRLEDAVEKEAGDLSEEVQEGDFPVEASPQAPSPDEVRVDSSLNTFSPFDP